MCNARLLRNGEMIKFDNLEISLQKYELKIGGKVVDLPPKELVLLYFLAANYNRVFTRDQLLDKVWGFDYLGDTPHRRRSHQASSRKAGGRE